MTASPAPAPQKTEKAHTKYVVLELDSGDTAGRYTIVGNFAATSQAAAIRKAGEDAGAGTYIAVPARSFVPTKVTVETTKTVRLG